jgi:hypothetical protein
VTSITCPGCGKAKSRSAQLCASCRKTATQLGASVLTAVATPAQPFTPRTPQQNRQYHGRLRTIALLEKPKLEGPPLWDAERKLKRWSIEYAARMVGRDLESSTELSEIEFERMNEWLARVIDDMQAGKRRPR